MLYMPAIVCQGRSYGRPQVALRSRNGLCGSSRQCIPRPRVMCGSMVSTVRSLMWELVCIRVLSLAHCSSFWYLRLCCVRSALAHHGSFSTLMTWSSSWTPKRSGSPSLRHWRLAWKVKGSASSWRRPSSWSLVMTRMSYRNLASTPALSVVVVSAETPSYAHNVCCGPQDVQWHN